MPTLGIVEKWLLGWQGYLLGTHLSGCIPKEPSFSERGGGKESAVPGRSRHRTSGCERCMGLAAFLPVLSLLTTVSLDKQFGHSGMLL